MHFNRKMTFFLAFCCFLIQCSIADAFDYLYVACRSGEIRQYDTDFNVVKSFGSTRNGPGENTIALDNSGNIFLSKLGKWHY
jgi:hypothetical protein